MKKINPNWVIAIFTVVNVVVYVLTIVKPFATSDIDVDVLDKIYLGQTVGDLHLSHEMYIKNTGDKTVQIKSIDVLLRRKDNKTTMYRMAADSYYDFNNNYHSLLDYTLKPGEFVQFTVFFESPQDLQKRDTLDYFRNAIYSDLERKVDNSAPNQLKIDDKLLNELKQYVKKGLESFKSGEYEYIITLSTNYSKKPVFVKAYNLSIYESHIKNILATVNNYKRGDNIFYKELNINPSPMASIDLTEIKDEPTIDQLKGELDRFKDFK